MWVLASALLVAACGETDEAKRGVTEFRSRAAQKSYGEIYRTAGAELRKGATEAQFERFMTTLDRRLGAWQSAAEPAWNVTRGTGGHLVRLTYESQFAKGAASEQFVWRLETGGPALLGYHVNSPLLMAQ
jgi:uncharacterized protein DUF4019